MGIHYGSKIPLNGLVLHVDPSNEKSWNGSSIQIKDLSENSLTLTKGVDTTFSAHKGSRTFSVSSTIGTLDTGYRYGSSSDKVVDSANSWTSMTWIKKSGAPNNWWHIFTDGNSGDILTVNESGNILTSMNNAGGLGTWSTGADFSYSTSWNSLGDGWYHLAVVYDRPNSRLQLYIDSIGQGWVTGRVINPGYKLRNFHGWGSANSSYHSDADHSLLSVYNRTLTEEELVLYYNVSRERFK